MFTFIPTVGGYEINQTQLMVCKYHKDLCLYWHQSHYECLLLCCIIVMSLQDFVDAFERLLKLGLKTQQEREIITVILECCCNESTYNAYYTHLMSKFITYHRRFLVSLHISLKLKYLLPLYNSNVVSCVIDMDKVFIQLCKTCM